MGNEEVVQWFLEHGADPNLRGPVYCSVLATAALHSSTSVLELLISHGAQLDPQALFHAMSPRGDGGIPVMKYLIDRGIDINAIGHMKELGEGNPLHYAVRIKSKEKVALLLESGADKTVRTGHRKTAADMAEDRGFIEIFELLSR